MKPVLAERVAQALQRGPDFDYRVEVNMRDGIADRLRDVGFTVRTEVRLSERDRIDLLVFDPMALDDGTLGIECKIAGPTSALRRQITRYGEHADRLGSLLVATTQFHHRALPAYVGEHVSVHVLVLGGL